MSVISIHANFFVKEITGFLKYVAILEHRLAAERHLEDESFLQVTEKTDVLLKLRVRFRIHLLSKRNG